MGDAAKATLWDWAVAAYADPAVKRALLGLQDRHGVDVVLTLWRIWTWETDRAVDPENEAEAVRRSAAWRASVVSPLREARNALKPPPDGMDPARSQALRRAVLEVELTAERLQLDMLEGLTGPPPVPLPARVPLADWLAAAPPLAHVPAVDISALAAALEARKLYSSRA